MTKHHWNIFLNIPKYSFPKKPCGVSWNSYGHGRLLTHWDKVLCVYCLYSEGLLSQNSYASRPRSHWREDQTEPPTKQWNYQLQSDGSSFLRGCWDSQIMYSTFYCCNGFHIVGLCFCRFVCVWVLWSLNLVVYLNGHKENFNDLIPSKSYCVMQKRRKNNLVDADICVNHHCTSLFHAFLSVDI